MLKKLLSHNTSLSFKVYYNFSVYTENVIFRYYRGKSTFNVESIVKDSLLYHTKNRYKSYGLTAALEECSLFSDRVIFNSISNNIFTCSFKISLLLKYILFFLRIRGIRGGFKKHPDFFDFLRFIINLYTNCFFPWLEATLCTNYFNIQLFRIKNRRMQVNWFRVNSVVQRYFLKLKRFRAFSLYKYFSVDRVFLTVKGRSCNYKFCAFARYRVWGNLPIYNKPWSILSFIYTADSTFFVTRWGSNSISIVLNYQNLISSNI